MRQISCAVFLALAVGAGCGTSGPGGGGGGGDAGGGGGADGGAAMQGLVGDWSLDGQRYSFAADGSFTTEFTDDEGALQKTGGSYTSAGNELTLDSTDTDSMTRTRVLSTFYAGATQLALPGFLPDGAHSGIVGKWALRIKTDELVSGTFQPQDDASLVYEFTAAGQVKLTRSEGGQAGTELSGTYVEQSKDRYLITVTSQGRSGQQTLFSIDGAALSTAPFARTTP